MLSGWVRLHRKLLESPVFTSRSPVDLKVFVACLLLANNQPRRWFNGTGEEEIPRGSFVTSQFKLAELTRLSRKEVRGAISRLTERGSIGANARAKHSTLITVVNFDAYQGGNDHAGQGEGHQRAKQGPTKGHNVRRKEGKKEKKLPTSLTPTQEETFAQFWRAYPRKVAMQAARAAWANVNPQNGLVETILEAIERQKGSRGWRRDEGNYIPYPTTWLNGRRWEDELPATGEDDNPYALAPMYSDADFDAAGELRPEADARETARIARLNGRGLAPSNAPAKGSTR